MLFLTGTRIGQENRKGKMKQVNGSVKFLIFCIGAVGLGIWANGPLWAIACGAVLGIFAIYSMIRPLCEYDDKIIKVHHFFKTYKHRWEEVKTISSSNYSRWTWVYFDNGGRFILGSLLTKNYSNVLRDFIKIIQDRNLKASIDKDTINYSKSKRGFRF